MPLSEDILRKLKRVYPPLSMIRQRFRGKHLAFKTDENGNPVQLFIGDLKEDGSIRGHRYARRMVKDGLGKLIRDHWDNKGPTR
jgi:hypothetical protein